MFKWLKSIGEKWCLVKTLSVPTEHNGVMGKTYFHLYESNKKSRHVRIETTLTLPDYFNINQEAKKFELYQERIHRWLEGRYDPEIPGYNEVPLEDTSNALKGKVS